MPKYFACLVKEKKVFASYFEDTYYFWTLFRKPHQTSVPAFLCSRWSILYSVHCTVYIHEWLLEHFLGSQFAFGTTSRSCYWKARTSFLKRVYGEISWKQDETLLWIFCTKIVKNSFKSTGFILRILEKIFISSHYPFKKDDAYLL
jgi:hypothetical protein